MEKYILILESTEGNIKLDWTETADKDLLFNYCDFISSISGRNVYIGRKDINE